MNDRITAVDDVPVATVKPITAGGPGFSKLWILTAACIAAAMGLAWWSRDPPGTPITIHFDRGHGIEPGAAIRHRGIDVGHVTDVTLREDLSGITVHATLDDHAASIARADSRFWIARPRVDRSGVSGLETVIGGKHLAVRPGDVESSPPADTFDGLPQPPADALSVGGIELLLRGDTSAGVGPGSAVAYRGVEIGRVLSSQLSPDAMHVDTRIRIDGRHRRLLAPSTKFWKNSGINVRLGVTGAEVTTDSLADVVRGGIAMITPAGDSPSDTDTSIATEVRPGDLFVLHDEPDPSWTADAASLPTVTDPPSTVTIALPPVRRLFGLTTDRPLVTAVRLGDALHFPLTAAVTDDATIEIRRGEQTIASVPAVDVVRSDDTPIATLAITNIADLAIDDVSNRLRPLEAPEDVVLISGSTDAMPMIGREHLHRRGDDWQIVDHPLAENLWSGAVAVALIDGAIVGTVVIDEDPRIVTFGNR